MRKLLQVSLAAVMLTGCANNAQTDALLGGLGGAGLGAGVGALLGHGDGRAIAAGALIGGAGGALIGGSIGAQLDARDRQYADAAIREALAEDYYRRKMQAESYASSGYQPTDAAPAPSVRTRRASAYSAPASSYQSASANDVPVKKNWVSPDTGDTGNISIVKAEPLNGAQATCTTVQSDATVHGRQVNKSQRYCGSGADWREAAASPTAPSPVLLAALR